MTTVNHTPSTTVTHAKRITDIPITGANTITQTYATTAADVPAATSAAVTDLVLTGTAIAAATASSTLTDAVNTNAGTVATSLNQAQKDIGAKINAVIADNTALRADVLALRKTMNLLIDILQANGLAG